jgi:eukaryotic-like serine/threonine-protein kinase
VPDPTRDLTPAVDRLGDPAAVPPTDDLTATATAAPVPELPGPAVLDARPAVPGYVLLDEVGRGGMGVVYRARDLAFGRDVAVKVLQDRFPADGVTALRFLDEARITGALQHPGVPAAYQTGVLPDGRPFLAMKLIRGDTLDDLIRGGVERGRLVAAFEGVCQAVGYAHAHGVVHRDLKPSNIMVGAFGEVQVMDWGLAKVLAAAESRTSRAFPGTARASGDLTQVGSLLGTPAYMAPEQADGMIDEVDERSDVFGLGAVLCAALTGRPPYTGGTPEGTRQLAARADQGDALAQLDASGADPGLIALCRRCLCREKAGRPADGGEVARAVADLRAAADDRARAAERDRHAALVRAAEQRKRRRVQAALGLTFTALVVLGGAFAWWRDRQAADRAAAELRARQAVDSAVVQATALRDQYQFADAAAILDQAAALVPPDAGELSARIGVARRELAFIRQLDEIRVGRIRPEARVAQPGVWRSYQDAFREFGIDPTGPDPAAAGAQVAESPIKRHLVIALDDWSWTSRDAETRRLLLAVLRRADPGPWSDRLRDEAVRSDPAAFDRLIAEADPAAVPAHLAVLVFQLRGRPWAAAPQWLAAAAFCHPDDFWVQFEAGYYYYAKAPQPALAALHLRAAHTLRPDLPYVKRLLLECVIRLPDHLDGAVVELRRLVGRDPASADAHMLLALALLEKKDVAGADAARAEASRLGPRDARWRDWFAFYLLERGDARGALVEATEAVRLDPTLGFAQRNLGRAREATGDRRGAIDAYREAIRLDPGDTASRDRLTALTR